MKKDEVELSSGLSAFEAKHFSRAMQLLSPLAENGCMKLPELLQKPLCRQVLHFLIFLCLNC